MVCPLAFGPEGLGKDAIRPVLVGQKYVWSTAGSSAGDINQTVERDDVVGGERRQHWHGGAAA
jgi:hypothetical protein